MILVPSPDEPARLEILKIKTRKMPLKGVDLKELAKRTEGYSGADLDGVCKEAGLTALRENPKAKEVTEKHFDAALEKIKASITEEEMERYKKDLSRTQSRKEYGRAYT
jgi:transitional endoplasmic reticulum ATPase